MKKETRKLELPVPDEHHNYKLSDGSFIYSSAGYKRSTPKPSSKKWFILAKGKGGFEVVWIKSEIAYFDSPLEAYEYLEDHKELQAGR